MALEELRICSTSLTFRYDLGRTTGRQFPVVRPGGRPLRNTGMLGLQLSVCLESNGGRHRDIHQPATIPTRPSCRVFDSESQSGSVFYALRVSRRQLRDGELRLRPAVVVSHGRARTKPAPRRFFFPTPIRPPSDFILVLATANMPTLAPQFLPQQYDSAAGSQS